MAIIDRINIGGNLFEIKDIAANQFVTKSVSDLLYYYTKDETFTKEEIRALIAQIQGMSIIPVQALPTASAETMGNIYLVPSSDPETRNLYDEYFTIESSGSYSWEMFGHAAISLDGLVTDEELESALSGKVDKETGKGLSTNDYTDAEKAKVDSALQSETDPTVPAWAKQPNKPSYTAQEVGALPANTPIPTALSDLSEDATHRVVTDTEKETWNGKYEKPSTGIPASDMEAGAIPDVSNFITKSVDDLVNYYLKSETFTKTEVQNLIGAIQQFHYEIYASRSEVTSPASNVLYLIGPTGTGADKYEEYVYDSTKQDPWVKIGDTTIDLSGYVTTSALNTALADYTTTANLTTLLSGKEDTSNKVTSLSAQSTDTQYPSARCVYDLIGDVETLINAL